MRSGKSTLLLSIQPRYVESILAGVKQVELRRRQPRIACDRALVYASSPRMELVAEFRIASIARLPSVLLWQTVRDVAGISRTEFDNYFEGRDAGVAIRIADLAPLAFPVSLANLRRAWPKFNPPQSFRYITNADLASLRPALARVA